MDRHRVKADIESISKTVLEQLTGSEEGDQKTQVVDSGGTNVDFATDAKLDDIISEVNVQVGVIKSATSSSETDYVAVCEAIYNIINGI